MAGDEDAWRALVERVIAHYADHLFNPNWGEQIRFDGNRAIHVTMTAQGLSEAEMRAAWAPFSAWWLESKRVDC